MREKNIDSNYEVFTITDSEVGKRLDVVLSDVFSEHSRSYIKKLIDENFVFVNEKCQKAGYKVKYGDIVYIEFPVEETYSLEAQNIPLDIVYQDEDIAVINKAKGMVVHPAVGNTEGTLVNAILYHIKDLSGINGELRPGIVHRIDKDTTGLLVIAKNDMAHRSLSEQIKNKTCKRIYKALVHGAPPNSEGRVVTYIGRNPKDRKKMAVVEENEGRLAVTNYKVLKKYAHFSLIEFFLETGRTHQIRVHCKYLNIPIVGDFTYGAPKNKFGIEGQLLHACKLILQHPRTNEIMTFEAKLPNFFQNVIDKLEKTN